ncbi:Trypsin [Popillia japonica]|uniref:Trypsin n=1 Tax=Popillia japonica TaxID=7064 RepID=A0AAW1LDS2_POPJA
MLLLIELDAVIFSIFITRVPWVAAIYTEGSKLCAGSIISPYHVLTVAHCFAYTNGTARNEDLYIVRVGKHYREPTLIESPTQTRMIKNLILHEEFRGEEERNGYDIGIIEVNEPFIFSSQDGTVGTVTGWGFLEEPGPRSNVLMKVNVAFWSRSTCYHQLPSHFTETYFSNDKICAGYINASRSLCYGDAGAGLVFPSDERYYLRGIGSTIMSSDRGCESNSYTLYTKVSHYISWIKSHISRKESIPITFRTRSTGFQSVVAGCALPNHIPHGKFNLVGKPNYIENMIVPRDSALELKCDDGNTNSRYFYCLENEWTNIKEAKCNIPGRCSSLMPTESEYYSCTNNNNKVSCKDPPYGTEAKQLCYRFFTNSGRKVTKCVAGKWNAPFTSCIPECGRKTITSRTLIVNGEEVQEQEYPWVVAIYDSTDEQICGGTIISREFVISAAHCFTELDGRKKDINHYTILAGKHYRSKHRAEQNTQESKVKSLDIHPEFVGQIQNYRDDIALIQLETPFQITGQVRPICIDIDNLYEEYDFIDGVKAVVAGWGLSTSGGHATQVLKKLEVPYVDRRKCKETFGLEFAQKYLTSDKICAGYHNMNKSVCNGDSGSGLYFKTERACRYSIINQYFHYR